MVLGCDGGADKAESYSYTGRRGKGIQWKKKKKKKRYTVTETRQNLKKMC